MIKYNYIILILILSISILYPQNKRVQIYINSGATFPIQPDRFREHWSVGYNLGIGIGYKLSQSHIFNIYFNYNLLPLNETDFLKKINISNYTGSLDGGDVTIRTLTANLKMILSPEKAATAYLVLGIGYFDISTSELSVETNTVTASIRSESEGVFGMFFGLGADLPPSEVVTIFVEVGYGIGLTENELTGYIPLKVGVRLSI